MKRGRLALIPALLALAACKKDVPLAQCPAGTANVDGVCRSICVAEADCTYAEACIDQVCLPRSAEEGPKIRLFQPDRIVVTPEDPTVHFDYVVTNASVVVLSPAPGPLGEHAGTLAIDVTETTDFVLAGRDDDLREDSKMRRIEVVDTPPPGEIAVSISVERSTDQPCDAVDVAWTVVGDLEGRTLEVRLEADGTEVFSSASASSRTTLPLSRPADLKMLATAGDLSAESQVVSAKPSMICSLTATPGMVAVGDTARLEWETKGAAVVFVEEEGTNQRLYTQPVTDRTSRIAGRWLVAPALRQRYRLVAVASDQGGNETQSIEISADASHLPPPLIGEFSVAPEWFRAPADLTISWNTRGGLMNRLFIGGAMELLPGNSGSLIRQLNGTQEIRLATERNGLASTARKLVWSTIDEVEPNDTPDIANPLALPSPQGGTLVARFGTLMAIQIQDVDVYRIQVDNDALRVRVFDPADRDCKDLDGARISVEIEGSSVFSTGFGEGCPNIVLDALRVGLYTITMTGMPDLAGGNGPSYVLAADPAPVVCGDGATEVVEACDDGNLYEGDGCDSACRLEPGFDYQTQSSSNDPPPIPVSATPLTFLPYLVDGDALDEGFAIIPADIQFFGQRYAGLMVHVNGYVTLLPDLTVEAGLGSPLAPNALIAALGSDLAVGGGSRVLTWTDSAPVSGQVHHVAYQNMQSDFGSVSFQIAVGENGDIHFNYDPNNSYPSDFVWVGGIEDGTGRYVYPAKGCTDVCIGPPTDLETLFLLP